jgi:hypothetical protein
VARNKILREQYYLKGFPALKVMCKLRSLRFVAFIRFLDTVISFCAHFDVGAEVGLVRCIFRDLMAAIILCLWTDICFSV